MYIELSRQFTWSQGLRNGDHDTYLSSLFANFISLCWSKLFLVIDHFAVSKSWLLQPAVDIGRLGGYSPLSSWKPYGIQKLNVLMLKHINSLH